MAESSDDIKKWIEWKEKCALDLCCDETRRFLGKQAEKKFYGFLYSEAKGELIYTRPERYEAWHLFETHCCVKVNKKFNKNYKDCIFHKVALAPSDDYMIAINGQFKDIMRDVARDYIKDYSLGKTISMQASMSTTDDSDDPMTIEDTLVAKDINLECIDSVENANKVSPKILEGIDRISKIILISEHAGISLDDKDVNSLTGLKRVALYRRIKILKNEIKSQINTLLNIKSSEELAGMNNLVINFMVLGIYIEFRSENLMAPFLGRLEEKLKDMFRKEDRYAEETNEIS